MHMLSAKADQTLQMHRLICGFPGCISLIVGLLCADSYGIYVLV